MDDIQKIAIGWFFGIVSTPLIAIINNHFKRESLQKVLIPEFFDIQIQTMLISFHLSFKTQNFTQPFLDNIKRRLPAILNHPLAKLSGLEHKTRILLDESMQLNDFLELNNNNKTSVIAPLEVAYLSSAINDIHLLTTNQQVIILALKKHFSHINSLISQHNMWLKMTFEISDANNHEACKENLQSCMQFIFQQSKIIDELTQNYLKEPNKFE
ncbi:MAG: hypothetical protein HYV97_03840 [Bdellovibrio sp.]|nr:hypothetical protein [Bdellovibrio sp.]